MYPYTPAGELWVWHALRKSRWRSAPTAHALRARLLPRYDIKWLPVGEEGA